MAKDGISFKFKESSLRNIVKRMQQYDKRSTKDVVRALKVAITKGEALAKTRVAVDTGRLRSSISSDIDEKDISATITANSNYAAYVEFGTGTGFKLTDSRQQSRAAAEWRGSGQRTRNYGARPFLYPALQLASVNFIRAVRNIYKRTKR